MAKKVKFLKDHLRHRAGEVALITNEAANYFIRCGVAKEIIEEIKDTKPTTPPKPRGRKKK